MQELFYLVPDMLRISDGYMEVVEEPQKQFLEPLSLAKHAYRGLLLNVDELFWDESKCYKDG